MSFEITLVFSYQVGFFFLSTILLALATTWLGARSGSEKSLFNPLTGREVLARFGWLVGLLLFLGCAFYTIGLFFGAAS